LNQPVVAALLVLSCLAALILGGCGENEASSDGSSSERSGDLLDAWRELGPGEVSPAEPPAPRVPGPSFKIARVREGARVPLYDRPEGAEFAELGDTTEFGSARSFWIARSRPGWLGVPVPELPNGRLAWIRDDPFALERLQTPFFIEADLSDRRLELHYGKRILERFPVTVGAPGSPTPPGAYAVTDGLAGRSIGEYYGCCILALTGHQPNLPEDWLGGDRIAIHGTPGATGLAASSGCLRATDTDMVSLFARVPLGAPVFIRA
jgi:hypothetical protein